MNKEKYALVSVSDKTGIVEFTKQIIDSGYKIISTGGTAKILTQNHISVTPIQEITGNPESFDGRMKTISFQIESGILFDRKNPKHIKEAKKLKIKPIDLIVCNLYPFEETIKNPKTTLDEAIENIDVGGPTMIRAAAKNFKNVLVVVDPNDYQLVTDHLHSPVIASEQSERGNPKQRQEIASVSPRNDKEDLLFRQKLAAKAFAHLSLYDSLIADYLSDDLFPQTKTLALRKTSQLRYGENPHQQAAMYMFPFTNRSPLNNLKKLWGRELSYVNITDINAGLESVRLFQEPAVVIIKHNCPCGIALGRTIDEALKRAIEADPESAFGGIIVLNKKMTLKAAREIGKFKDESHANIDIVAVPDIDQKALEFLKSVRKSMGIYTFGNLPKKESKHEHIKMIDGGLVIQTYDTKIEESFKDWRVVSRIKPSKKQRSQMEVAWKFISRIKSNAIIIVDKDIPMTRGIGTGQTSRVRSVKIALEQAGNFAKGAVLASDSFFPFDDSVRLAAKAGITAIVQQGGSINDKASINAADEEGIAMIFTNRRAFWH